MNGPWAHVEFHDARIASIAFDADGSASVLFSHLTAFRRVVAIDERYELWRCLARLDLHGVTAWSSTGAFADVVLDLDLVAADDETVTALGVGASRVIRRVRIAVAGATAISIEARRATLVSCEGIEPFEEWEGPLR